MKNLVKYVQNINTRYCLWKCDDVIVVGVSGGPDSMCLLDVMVQIAAKESLTVVVAHVNYGLRGVDSDTDQRLVEEAVKKYSLICEVKSYKDCKKSDENHLRQLRYVFFTTVQKKYGAQKIAVAHTKNDQAETMLLHLLRGSGLAGLGGMQLCSAQGVIRPLLLVSRDDIVAYCEQQCVIYHTDKSNTDNKYMRNRIRNELLPILYADYNPQIIEVLADAAMTIADEYATLVESIVPFWRMNSEKKCISFDVGQFLEYNSALQRLVLRQMIMQLCGNVINIEKGFIEEMRNAILHDKNKPQEIRGKDLKMNRKGDKVKLTCC